MKQELVLFFQELYKPKSQFDQERVEYNQINILAEYVLYNIVFAKNELMYDEFKVAVIVDIFWRLLEFDPEDPNEKKDKENAKESEDKQDQLLNDRKSQEDGGNGGEVQFRGDDIDIEKDFEQRLLHKFALFK